MRKPNMDVVGDTYHDLKIINISDKRNKRGRVLYECVCLLCGNTRFAELNDIKRGKVKNCGCYKHRPKANLLGKTINNIQVLGTTMIDNKLHYTCKCLLCGNDFIASANDIRQNKSCGCLHKANIKKLFMDGTAPCKLKNNKLRKTNTSGVTGVYYNKAKKKWDAEIVFKKQKHFLGRFDTKEEAAKARKEGEEKYFKAYLENNSIMD